MAISTYAELQTAVANWSSRSDLTSRSPEFIAMAESEFNRLLRTRDQETKDAAFSIAAEYVNVPSGFLEAKSFYLNVTPRRTLKFMPNDAQTDIFGSDTGQPAYFTVVAGQFRFGKPPSSSYTGTLVYYKQVPALASNSTNWLLTANPDAYLYASLYHAGTLLGDPELEQKVEARYMKVIAQLVASDSRSKWGGNSMEVRVG